MPPDQGRAYTVPAVLKAWIDQMLRINRSFRWQTHETNATAMRLYDQVAERSGFVVYRKGL